MTLLTHNTKIVTEDRQRQTGGLHAGLLNDTNMNLVQHRQSFVGTFSVQHRQPCQVG